MRYKFAQIAINSTAKKKPTEEDKTVYVGLEHIVPGDFFIKDYGSDVTPKGDKLLMKKGDVLFGKRRAYQRKVAIAPCDGIFSAHGMVLRPMESVVDKDFFPFFISSDQFMNEAIRISVGGLSPTINWKDLKECEFSLPPLSEQRVLADKLWAAYRLKESYKKLIDATKDIVKAKFVEMTQTSPKVRIREVASISKVSIMPKAGSKYNLYSFPAFDNDRTPEYIDGSEIKSSKIVLPRECVLYNKLNVRLCRVWNIKLEKDNNNICSSEFLPFIPNGSISSAYFYRCLLSDSVTTAMTMASKGTSNSQKRITPKDILDFEIPLPNASIQKSFVALASQADLSLSTLRSVITSVDSVMKSLINN